MPRHYNPTSHDAYLVDPNLYRQAMSGPMRRVTAYAPTRYRPYAHTPLSSAVRSYGLGRVGTPRGRVAPGFTRRSGFYGRFSRFTRGSRVEQKFKDTSLNDTLGTGMIIQEPCVVVQGDGESERIGRRMFIKSIFIKGVVTLPPVQDVAETATLVKMMVVQDKQTNGTKFAPADLLVTDSYDSFNQLANKSRFKILKTQYFKLVSKLGASNSGSTYVTGEDIANVYCYLKLDVPIEFDGTTGVVGTVRSNNVYITWQLSSSNTFPSWNGESRIRYTD